MIRSTSPQQPNDVVAEAAEQRSQDVIDAITQARAAQRVWSESAAARSASLHAIAQTLRARADEATALMVREVGKPVVEARGEIARAIAITEYYAQAALDPIGDVLPSTIPGLLLTQRTPHGVAGLITPWNFPIAIPLWKAAPALSAGNTVVLKPSEFSIGCAQFLAEVIASHTPEKTFTVLPGLAETGAAVVANADVISFTGSVGVGKQIVSAAAAAGKPVQAEMGGQNPAIVLPDADLGLASTHLAQAAMGFAGQKCTATRRIIVVGDQQRFDEVRQAILAAVAALAPADPADDGVLVGPVISQASRAKLLDAVGAAAQVGRVLQGGKELAEDGWFVTPAVVEGIPAGHSLLTEETFAPLVALIPASSVNEAIALANSVRFGLTASVHGKDLEALLRVARNVETGMVKINAPTAGVDFHAPFGGSKDSSYGEREQGKAALNFYTYSRTITIGAGTATF